MKNVIPFTIGQKISCSKSVWEYPHDLREKIVVSDVQFIPLSFRTQRDIERKYFGHWRIYGHLEKHTEFTINGPEHCFFIV
jgi:hypothetical protein